MATKKYDGPRYAYTQSAGKTADDKFDVDAVKKGEARLLDSDVPDKKAMRYIKNDSLSELLNPKPGGGRGNINPRPVNVSEEDYVSPKDQYEADKAKAEKRDSEAAEREYNRLMPKKMAKGGSASSRADGIAQRGKTRGTIVMCGGGAYKK